jgi:hypothetical protein
MTEPMHVTLLIPQDLGELKNANSSDEDRTKRSEQPGAKVAA